MRFNRREEMIVLQGVPCETKAYAVEFVSGGEGAVKAAPLKQYSETCFCKQKEFMLWLYVQHGFGVVLF